MNKKTIFTILGILILPLVAFFMLTFNNTSSTMAEASGKPQILKFTSTMCLECKEVNKVFKEVLPQYADKVTFTEIIVDSRNDMKDKLIKEHNVTLVPTIIMLNSDGTQYKRIESSLPKEQLEEYIKGLK